MEASEQGQFRVLVVDDEPEVGRFLKDILVGNGYTTVAVTSGAAATSELDRGDYAVVLTDLRMGAVSGFDLIEWIQRKDPRIPVIAVTAFGSIQTAIQAIKLGAFDYLTKPFTPEVLLIAVEKALRERSLRGELARLRVAVDQGVQLDGIVARSHAMAEVLDLVRRVAPTPTTVLITGASGTGKEVIARALHRLSPRRNRPFVAVNCAAIPETLLESELFGHVRGAFTDAHSETAGVLREAEGGTLLLDEVGEMPLGLQPKILRALQEREVRPVGASKSVPVDVRIVAATNRDLGAAVVARTFREDLYYRLNVVGVHLPPLRDRPEDIPALAQKFLSRHAERMGKPIKGYEESAMRALLSYPWPGNVRELENVVERAVTLATRSQIILADLPDAIPIHRDTDFLSQAAARQMSMEELQRAYLHCVLERTGGNKLRAAQFLGVDRKTIYRWLGQTSPSPGEGRPVES